MPPKPWPRRSYHRFAVVWGALFVLAISANGCAFGKTRMGEVLLLVIFVIAIAPMVTVMIIDEGRRQRFAEWSLARSGLQAVPSASDRTTQRGEVQGREAHLEWLPAIRRSRGLGRPETLELTVSTRATGRFAVVPDDDSLALPWPLLQQFAWTDPAHGGVRMVADDHAWAARLLADPAAQRALPALVRAPLGTSVCVRVAPGVVRLWALRAGADVFLPEHVTSALDDMTALATAAERAGPPDAAAHGMAGPAPSPEDAAPPVRTVSPRFAVTVVVVLVGGITAMIVAVLIAKL